MKAKYICIEGTDGVGKSTYVRMLTSHLRNKGFKVLETKEPGTPLAPITMELRNIMLNADYDDQLTMAGRELISQAIRSIHIEKVIMPALSEYDYIIQDRGLLSGLAYGSACGNPHWFLINMTDQIVQPTGTHSFELYDKVIYLRADVSLGLSRAKRAKQEFSGGDVIEAKGNDFIAKVADSMNALVKNFSHCIIDVGEKTIDETFKEVLAECP